MKVDLFYFEVDAQLEDDTFKGIGFNYPVSPYIGAAIFGGQDDFCDETINTCDRKYILGLYPEAGLMLNISGNFAAQLFARKYLFNNHVKDFESIGLGVILIY